MKLTQNFGRWSLLGLGAAGLIATSAPVLAYQDGDCPQEKASCCDKAKAGTQTDATARIDVKKKTDTKVKTVTALPMVKVVETPPDAKTSFKYMSTIQDEDGTEHTVSLSRSIADGKEKIDLTIDGKKYDVKSMEEANRILEQKGLGNMRLGLGDEDHDIDLFGGENDNGELFIMPFGKHDEKKMNQNQGVVIQPTDQQPKAMLGVQLNPVDPAIRGYLGIPENEGVMVLEVLPDTPAEAAGLEANDIIVAVRKDDERTPVNDQSLRKIIADHDPGDKLMLEIVRRGRTLDKTVKLGKWNAEKFGIPQGQQQMQLRPMKPDQMPQLRDLQGLDPNELMQHLQDQDGFRTFRLELDPETGEWRFKGDEDNEKGQEQPNDDQMQGMDHDQMMQRMMQMMEERMRQFEERMNQLLQQQRQMRRDINKQKQQKSDVDA